MKKALSIVMLACIGASILVSCGPSEAEKKKIEEEQQKKVDSLMNSVTKSIGDAMNADTAAKAAVADTTKPAK